MREHRSAASNGEHPETVRHGAKNRVSPDRQWTTFGQMWNCSTEWE
jgi:hypothetical protein